MITFLFILQGKISFKNLKRVAKELGENLTDEELQVSPWLDAKLHHANLARKSESTKSKIYELY